MININRIQFSRACKRLTYLLLILAAGAMVGCVQLNSLFNPKAEREIVLIKKYYRQGDYQRSLNGCFAITNGSTKGPYYDQALYYSALNCLHRDSKDGDYTKAIYYFRRIIDECPGSSFLPESARWFTLLTDLASQKNEIAVARYALEEKESQLLEKELQLGKKESQLSKKESQLSKNDQKIQNMQSEIDKLKKKIDLLEKVDIQIHQKKKDLKNEPDQGNGEGKSTGIR